MIERELKKKNFRLSETIIGLEMRNQSERYSCIQLAKGEKAIHRVYLYPYLYTGRGAERKKASWSRNLFWESPEWVRQMYVCMMLYIYRRTLSRSKLVSASPLENCTVIAGHLTLRLIVLRFVMYTRLRDSMRDMMYKITYKRTSAPPYTRFYRLLYYIGGYERVSASFRRRHALRVPLSDVTVTDVCII